MVSFPRATVASVSLSRMIIGTNKIFGWSHWSLAVDRQIKHRFPEGRDAVPLLKAHLDEGADNTTWAWKRFCDHGEKGRDRAWTKKN